MDPAAHTRTAQFMLLTLLWHIHISCLFDFVLYLSHVLNIRRQIFHVYCWSFSCITSVFDAMTMQQRSALLLKLRLHTIWFFDAHSGINLVTWRIEITGKLKHKMKMLVYKISPVSKLANNFENSNAKLKTATEQNNMFGYNSFFIAIFPLQLWICCAVYIHFHMCSNSLLFLFCWLLALFNSIHSFLFRSLFLIVVAQAYKVDVEVLAASRGCTAILRCVIPTFVKELVRVISWVQEPAFYIYPSLQGGNVLTFVTRI